MSSEYSSEGSYPSSSSFSSSSSDEHDDDDRESVSSSPAMTRRRRKGTKSGTDVSRRGKRLPEGLWEECRRKAMQEDGEEAMARALEMPDEDEGNDVSEASGKAKGKGKGKGKVKKAKMGKADRERKKKQAEAGQGNKEVKFLEVRTPRWRSGDVSVASSLFPSLLPYRGVVSEAGERMTDEQRFLDCCSLAERRLCEPGSNR
jgi:hypothetical protein